MRDEVDKAWNSDITQTIFKGNVPSGIDYVCFGNISVASAGDSEMNIVVSELKNYGEDDKNSFIYPPKRACEIAFYNLKHASFDSFFCVREKSGSVSVKLSKSSSDALVKLSRP